MNEQNMGSWVSNAKAHNSASANAHPVQVIRRNAPKANVVPSVGNIIMEVAEKLRPIIARTLQGVRNDEGTILQPAHIRGIALDMAEGLVKKQLASDAA